MQLKILFGVCRVIYVVMAIYAQSMLRTCICTCQSVQPTTCAASFLLLLESLPDFCVPVLPSSCPSTSQKTIGHLAEDIYEKGTITIQSHTSITLVQTGKAYCTHLGCLHACLHVCKGYMFIGTWCHNARDHLSRSSMLIPQKIYCVQFYHLARKSQDQEQLPWQQFCGAAGLFHRNAQKETNKLLSAAGTNKVKGNNNIYTIYTTLLYTAVSILQILDHLSLLQCNSLLHYTYNQHIEYGDNIEHSMKITHLPPQGIGGNGLHQQRQCMSRTISLFCNTLCDTI